MATKNGATKDSGTTEAAISTSLEVAAVASSAMNENEQDSNKSKGDERVNKVPFHKLFSFADSTDILFMVVGSIGAVGNGLSLPLIAELMGELINAFGKNHADGDVVDLVSKIALKFVYLALGCGTAAFLMVSCWMVTGERQAARIRAMYLQTMLRQDVAFFDKETDTVEIIGRMSGDTILIQNAMGEKVGKFIQLMSTFIGGFVIAFINGWLLTLVLLIMFPLLVLAGGARSLIISKQASHRQSAYAKAANVVEKTIGLIRTVESFTGEKRAIANYSKFLEDAYRSDVHEGLAGGLGLGTIFLIIFGGYALAIWYGAKLILDKGYTGGAVINVIMAVLNGSLCCGNSPHVLILPKLSKSVV